MFKLDTVNIRSPTNLPYYRMAGYLTTIVLHGVNISVMLGRIDHEETDPNLRLFASMQNRFITCWTFVFQMIYAALGISCDLLALQAESRKEHPMLKTLKTIRDVSFASIVVPFSLMVFTMFWPLFTYDRELILPLYTSKIIDGVSNVIMHIAIVPIVLWEMVFQPRTTPKSHITNILTVAIYSACYVAVLMFTYFEKGRFPYPILTMLYGNTYFFLLIAVSISWLPLFYFLQWKISALCWKKECKKIE